MAAAAKLLRLLLRIHPHQHHLLRRHHGLTTPQRTLNRWSPVAHFVTFLSLLLRNFQHIVLWVHISGSSMKVSLGSAIRSDVTNASAAETVFVGSTLPSTFCVAFARIVSGIGENFFAVAGLPASSPMCRLGMLPLHAITAKVWHSPTGSRMQQVP